MVLYQDINRLFAGIDTDVSAAECHGIAAGMLCVNGRAKPEFWLEELCQGADEIKDEAKTILTNLFEATRRLLVGEDYSFALLLPDEEAPLSEQLEALREWCQGFLYGIGSEQQVSAWSAEVMEVVKDIAEFTKLETETEGEEAENAFMIVTEYLRTSVVFLYSELNPVSKDNMLH